MSDDEYTESIEQPAVLSEQDQADLEELYSEGDVPEFHPILLVWVKVLEPAENEMAKPVTPDWATKMVSTYPGLAFHQMNVVRDSYFSKIIELRRIVELAIEEDPDSITYSTPEEDLEHNADHYRNTLMQWQLQFRAWELAWDCTHPDAAAHVAAFGEVYKMFFGQTGLTQFLDNIRFNERYTEADQADLARALDELSTAGLGESGAPAEVTGE